MSDFRECTITIYHGAAIKAVRCYQEFTAEGYTMPYGEADPGSYAIMPVTNLAPDTEYRKSVGQYIPEQYFYDPGKGGYMGSNQPSELIYAGAGPWFIIPDGSWMGFPLFKSYYSDFDFSKIQTETEIRARPNNVETADLNPNDGIGPREYNICDIPIWYVNNYPVTGAVKTKIWGYTITCPFPINREDLPSIDDLNKPPPPPPPPLPPPPTQDPPGYDMCCNPYLVQQQNDLYKMTRELYQVVDPPNLRKSEIPSNFPYPGATGTLKLPTLDKILEALFLTMNHYSFQPFSLKLADVNAAKEGKQSVDMQFNSLSQVLQKLCEWVIDINADGDISNNMLMRLGINTTLMQQVLEVVRECTKGTADFLDYEQKQTLSEIPLMFNPYAGQKGFGNPDPTKIGNDLDKNDEKTTEQLMPQFLQTKKHKVKVVENVDKQTLTKQLYEIRNLLLSNNTGTPVR